MMPPMIPPPASRPLTEADLSAMAIPRSHWRDSLDRVPASVKPTVLRYLEKLSEMLQAGAGLYCVGNTGTGKTAVASIILRYARSRFHAGYLFSVPELIDATHARDDVRVAAMTERARSVALLVLDNLRATDLADRFVALSTWESLLRHRADKGLTTMVTTQVSMRDIGAASKPLASLLNALTVPLLFEGEDQRAHRAAELAALVRGTK